MTKVACDHASEFLQNATEAWDDERQELLAKLKTAHMSISDAHTDQKEAAGDMVMSNLENALADTKATLSMAWISSKIPLMIHNSTTRVLIRYICSTTASSKPSSN